MLGDGESVSIQQDAIWQFIALLILSICDDWPTALATIGASYD